jgi:hypothetical protein
MKYLTRSKSHTLSEGGVKIPDMSLHEVHASPFALLSERDGKILEFERDWWRHAGAKEVAIKELFNLTPTSYYQILNGIIDMPEALEAAPILVKRLRRLRDGRLASRTA